MCIPFGEQLQSLQSQLQEANQRIAELTKENIDLSLSVQFWKGEAENAQKTKEGAND